MITETIKHLKNDLATTESNLFRLTEQRIALLNQISIAEELAKQKVVPNDNNEVKGE